jgi:hypothetical protein
MTFSKPNGTLRKLLDVSKIRESVWEAVYAVYASINFLIFSTSNEYKEGQVNDFYYHSS